MSAKQVAERDPLAADILGDLARVLIIVDSVGQEAPDGHGNPGTH
jgi:hypothetical protein